MNAVPFPRYPLFIFLFISLGGLLGFVNDQECAVLMELPTNVVIRLRETQIIKSCLSIFRSGVFNLTNIENFVIHFLIEYIPASYNALLTTHESKISTETNREENKEIMTRHNFQEELTTSTAYTLKVGLTRYLEILVTFRKRNYLTHHSPDQIVKAAIGIEYWTMKLTQNCISYEIPEGAQIRVRQHIYLDLPSLKCINQ